jgi:hypothetical protein
MHRCKTFCMSEELGKEFILGIFIMIVLCAIIAALDKHNFEFRHVLDTLSTIEAGIILVYIAICIIGYSIHIFSHIAFV